MALGVNFFGPIYSEDGIGEAARLNLKVFQAAGIDLAINPISRPVAREKTVASMKENFKVPYSINYFHFSSRWVPYYMDLIGTQYLKNRFNIGYWVTEVQEYPLEWAENHRYFSEIWTASYFCQDSISRKIPIPVILIPHPIVAASSRSCNKRDRFTFLVMANAYSDIERKNVVGSLKAFTEAFPNETDVALVLKLSNSDVDQNYFNRIKQYVDQDNRIELIDAFIDREDLDTLYKSVDAYISLHRAEGFGLTLGEAMYHEVPVITTAYSGNVDFCNNFNSYLVDYDLVPVGEDRLRYLSTDLWAEPSIESTVEALRRVYKNPVERQQKINRAKRFVDQNYSIEHIAERVRDRISLINAEFDYSRYTDL